MRRVVSQGWLHASWRPRFIASHLSWTTHPRLQHQAAVKVHGVFPSNHGYSASSPRLQFHRIPRRDSAQVVAPFVQVGTSCSPSISGGTDYPFTLRNRTQGPASDHAHRFARRQGSRSQIPSGIISRYGVKPNRASSSEEPTSHGITLSRHDVLESVAYEEGFPVISRFIHWNYSQLG